MVADCLLVTLGDPEEHADHTHRHLRTQIGNEIEAVGADERVEAVGAELTDLGLELGHASRGEGTRQQAAMNRVSRRVLKDDDAGRDLDVRLDDLEDGTFSGDVGLGVEQSLLDVLEPADGEEVVFLVVVDRRFLAQSPVDGIRVGVDLDAVLVVVDVAHACLHGASGDQSSCQTTTRILDASRPTPAAARHANRRECIAMIDETFASRDLSEAGRGIGCHPLNLSRCGGSSPGRQRTIPDALCFETGVDGL